MSKKMVEKITSRDEDFSQWYTDIVLKSELISYSDIKGNMIIRPYGYAIWEKIKKILDNKILNTGHSNLYMPLFIPEKLLQKESNHIEGFAPEVAWIETSNSDERYCVRPTSEVTFANHFKDIIHSYRDLPKLYNQWSNVVRLEKNTRPFLRTMEFLWQEGHTCHATADEAKIETKKMINIYKEICENVLSIPVIMGKKSNKEKFAGAEETYTIESLMYDGKALQSGTSHYLGDNFAKNFDITYLDKNGKEQYVYQSSWGFTTRIIGAMIMVHSDDYGLLLPPKVAPIQVVIVPIAQHKEGVLDFAYSLKDSLNSFDVTIEDSDKSPGWKFNECEMKGIPIRIEVGPKEIEEGVVTLFRRDTREKQKVELDNLQEIIKNLLQNIQENMLYTAKNHLNNNIFFINTYDEFKTHFLKNNGFVKTYWCGNDVCENKIKEDTGATSRVIENMVKDNQQDKCVCCDNLAKNIVYWAKAY
ncbi:proline--tRNA ligase [Staphylococcus gallinarum]|uniref:proline--tRNA ligase n=1 Tax=Staphylococcus gallinarum TaxID=1293 RepID=UPI002DB6C8E4|nr:proline--tRNA ligase [Staphylococcus gallinarum]MEB7040099.1 proline--tRNA ligase [Staphylococcus gallinarum]